VDVLPIPPFSLEASDRAAALPSHSDAVGRRLRVPASDQDLRAAMAVIGLDAIAPEEIGPALRDPLHRYARLFAATAADNTLRGRRADIRGYVTWTQECGLAPIPASGDGLSFQIESYLIALGSTHAPRSVSRIGSSLGLLAQGLGLDTLGAPERRRLAIRAGRRLARTARGTALRGAEKSRLSPADIDYLLAWLASDSSIPDGVRIRDAAIIRVFVDILARRSEVAGLKIGDVRLGKHADLSINDQPAGMLFLARSKSDQEGRGTWCGISPATVSAVESWIEFAELDDGDAPLFRALNRDGTIRASSAGHLSGESMNEMIKRHVRRSGILAARPEIESNISAHSIRRGVARALWEAGRPDREIMELGRWATEKEMRNYVGLPVIRCGALSFLELFPVRET
jgi:integrase